LAEGEDTVVVVEVETGNVALGGDGAVVGVVEKQGKVAVAAEAAEAGDEVRSGPFVDDNDIGIVYCRSMIEARSILLRAQVGEVNDEPGYGLRSLIFHQIAAAPAVCRLKRQHVVTAAEEIAHDAAEEVGVAVVPVGDEGVSVEDELHA